MKLVFLGLSITSSWDNWHASTYRALLRALASRGHDVVFLERDVPIHALHRDLPAPSFATAHLYASVDALDDHLDALRGADLVVLGSGVPDGARVADWLLCRVPGRVAFYDIDAPMTLAGLDCIDWLRRDQIPRFPLYLTFAGGAVLGRLERELGSPCARSLYCSIDPDEYFPERRPSLWDLGYLGTYGADRLEPIDELLLAPARAAPSMQFVLFGPHAPPTVRWPLNLDRREHLRSDRHREFYNSVRYTLNVMRREGLEADWSPSVRLLEAAACGTPVISEPGVSHLFVPGREILLAETTADVIRILATLRDENRLDIGQRARRRVLAEHTASRRAEQLEAYIDEVFEHRHVGCEPRRSAARCTASTSS